jgi:hypothetical protein
MHIIQLAQTQFPPQETNAHLLWGTKKKGGEPNKLRQWVQANCELFALDENSTLLGTNQTPITPAAHSAHATRIHLPMMEDPLRRSSCLPFSQLHHDSHWIPLYPAHYCTMRSHRFSGFLQ